MKRRIVCPFLALAGAVVLGTLAPLAAADAVYHTEHLPLKPVGGAPLRSGFVQNIKAEGPNVYAHELFQVNGAVPSTTYIVTRRFFAVRPRLQRRLRPRSGGDSRGRTAQATGATTCSCPRS